MKDIRIPTCMDCPHQFLHDGRTALIKKNVSLQPFERYCMAAKRPKQIRKSGLMKKPPSWCPKLKNPCELRVYGFVDDETRRMHTFFSDLYGKSGRPNESRYMLRFAGTTDMSPREFWRRCNDCGTELGLPTDVQMCEVVEIDDGLRPVCFYYTEHGYQIETLFKPERVQHGSKSKE